MAKFGSRKLARCKNGAAAAKSPFPNMLFTAKLYACSASSEESGGLLKWCIEFLNSAERFTELVHGFPRLPFPRHLKRDSCRWLEPLCSPGEFPV